LSFAVTVLEGIQRSADFLGARSVEAARLQAELLLAHVLGLPRMQLYLQFERALTEKETDRYRELIKRRGSREPLQQIIGSTSFCGLEIVVNRYVLVPRPETELLAETAWTFLRQLPVEPAVLDFGTGSGCLAIALAIHSPLSRITAVDISSDALALARQNAAAHSVGDRIKFYQGEGLAALPQGLRFDLLVSNPPYIPTAEIATLHPEVRDFEPHQALDGGADGLNFYRRLSAEASLLVKPGAAAILEFGDGQAETVCGIFEAQNWIVEQIIPDYSQRPRIVIARTPV
jgi:release factor glutamine methyltransferase